MKVGVPAEIKPQESRVGLTPNSVEKLISYNHKVIIQDNAGLGAGFENSDYIKVGAKIAPSAGDVFNDSDMIVKVNLILFFSSCLKSLNTNSPLMMTM